MTTQVTNANRLGTISERLYHSDQSWHYEWIGIAGSNHGRKYKVSIRRASTKSQSGAQVSIFDPTLSRWNEIVGAPWSELECKLVESIEYPPGGRSNPKPGTFHADRDRLLNEAIAITQ